MSVSVEDQIGGRPLMVIFPGDELANVNLGIFDVEVNIQIVPGQPRRNLRGSTRTEHGLQASQARAIQRLSFDQAIHVSTTAPSILIWQQILFGGEMTHNRTVPACKAQAPKARQMGETGQTLPGKTRPFHPANRTGVRQGDVKPVEHRVASMAEAEGHSDHPCWQAWRGAYEPANR